MSLAAAVICSSLSFTILAPVLFINYISAFDRSESFIANMNGCYLGAFLAVFFGFGPGQKLWGYGALSLTSFLFSVHQCGDSTFHY